MASSPGAPRHAGRIVDPSVLGDSGAEPELELEPAPDGRAQASLPSTEDAAAAEEFVRSASPPPPDSDDAIATPRPAGARGESMRDRLLARAAAARGDAARARTLGALDEVVSEQPPASRPLEVELDLVGVGNDRPPLAPPPRRRTAGLSMEVRALVGALLGVATVCTISALAMRIEQHEAAQPAPSASRGAPPAGEPEADGPPPVPKRIRVKLPGPWRIDDDGSADKKLHGKIGSEAFLHALSEAGIDAKQAYRVHAALKDLRNLDKCGKTDEFAALVEPATKTVKAFEYMVSKEEVYQLRAGADGALSAQKLDLKVERAEVKGAIVIDGAFAASAERAGFERDVEGAVKKALDGHLGLDELKRGDVLRVVAQEVTVLGEFSRYAGVEVIEVRPADGKEKPERVYYYNGKSERGYYDADGRSPYEGGWRKPIKDAPITSKYNPKRMHPVLHKVMPHQGTDFGAPAGTPVGASSYGKVTLAAYTGPCGNTVKLEHGGGIETGYCHLSRFAEGLKVGDHVRRMQLIGYVGSTGRSTGPHLHFYAKKNGEFFDAESLNLDAMRVLPKDERELFVQVKARFDALLDEVPIPTPLPAAAARDEPAVEQSDEPDLGAPMIGSAQVPAASGAPAAPAGSHHPGGSAVFLTDKDLLLQQGSDDEGESQE